MHVKFIEFDMWMYMIGCYDIRSDYEIFTNEHAPKHRTPEAVLESAAKEKERIYQKAVEDRHGQFAPFVVWTFMNSLAAS